MRQNIILHFYYKQYNQAVAYLEFMKGGGGATFDKLKSCNKVESQTECLVEYGCFFNVTVRFW